MAFVWSSARKWKAIDLVSLVSNSDHRLDHNVLRNLLSWSEIMVYGMPKWTHTCSKKSLEVSVSLMFFLQACEDGHLQKPINEHKYTIISLLGGQKARHVID
jgi:hypothetical protein